MLFTPAIATLLTVAVLVLFGLHLWLLGRKRREVEPTEAFGNSPPPGPIRRGAGGFWSFLVRWQDFSGWMPLCLGLGILAFIGFGALDRHATSDLLPIGAVLPWKLLYAFGALGILYLFRRRWRRKLTEKEQRDLWERAVQFDVAAFGALGKGTRNLGAIIIYVTDAVVSLCALYWLLRFFALPA